MRRSLLLIVDGESLRTPGLAQALERDGWNVEWSSGAQASQVLAGDELPDLLLFDPALISDQGLTALADLHARTPGLPMVALGAPGQDEGCLRLLGLEPTLVRRLDRNAKDSWSASLRASMTAFGPGAQKFTAEDLFGDILAEMEAPEPAPRPRPVAAPAAPPASPASPAPSALSALFAKIMEDPEQPPVVATLRDDGYTLSGIAGIQDPFGPSAGIAPPASRAAVKPAGPALNPSGPAVNRASPALNPASPALNPPVNAASPSVNAPRPAAATPRPPAAAPTPEVAPPLEAALEEFGNYYLLEKIAVGGMAELFKARQRGVHDFEKIVAIKRILPHFSDNDEFVRMFIDEAKLAAQLTHPNIAQIFDLGKASGFYYIAMEFVDGRDLRTLLRKVREYKLPVPEALAAAVVMKVANALDYAHRERGINDRELKLVHRDISPQNILISYDGAVKLVDFGIAKAATKNTNTMAGALKGKLLYMSPEQALGQHLDGRSDIYSLGLVLFELLTGERCFQADSELGVLEKVRQGKVLDARSLNPRVSLEMSVIMDKVLQRNVEQRYSSARLLERDLKGLLVKGGNEPTEHDVAEYVNTLLKGTREELAELLASHYAQPIGMPQETLALAAVPEDTATLMTMREPLSATMVAPEQALASPSHPRWFLPLMLVAAIAVVALGWIFLR